MKKEIIEVVAKFEVPKFTRPDVIDEMTKQMIKDTIQSQETEIENLKNEIERKNECIKHYKKYL